MATATAHTADFYSAQDHETWRLLFERLQPEWSRYATPEFLQGLDILHLNPNRIPLLPEVNRKLRPRTGFQAKAVGGYVPAFEFFDCLRKRQFPTTITIRKPEQMNYLPEPDIFHDVAGHVPMHTDRRFADTLVRFGECAHTAAARAQSIADSKQRTEVTASVIRAMARFFWFTIEFGLMQTREGLKAYGSGLMSSRGEIEHSVRSDTVQRYPLQLEWVINQSFEIHHYQPLLFVADSFEQVYSLVDELESWMRSGRLDHVAQGEPAISEADLGSFLDGSRR
jgi:phenylalanine-4-hydroxylase